jgi:hypothetical protein
MTDRVKHSIAQNFLYILCLQKKNTQQHVYFPAALTSTPQMKQHTCCPVLNLAQRYEDVWGCGCIDPYLIVLSSS